MPVLIILWRTYGARFGGHLFCYKGSVPPGLHKSSFLIIDNFEVDSRSTCHFMPPLRGFLKVLYLSVG
jgi:hypothetical protein